MSTFAGRYIKEPSDLLVVAPEAEQIRGMTDGLQVAATKFADLDVDELAVAVSVANPLIADAEETLESYADRRGYVIPLSTVGATAMKIMAKWFWIGILARGGTLSGPDAQKQYDDMRKGELEDIATGKIILSAAFNTTVEPIDSSVYSISDAATRDGGQGRVERVSRSLLAGF